MLLDTSISSSKHAYSCSGLRQLAYQAITILNDLYVNDTVSAFEISKKYTKPIDRSVSPRRFSLKI